MCCKTAVKVLKYYTKLKGVIMRDIRIDKLASVLVNHSTKIQKGEKCLIEAFDIDNELVKALIEKVYEAGGIPFVQIRRNAITRSLINNAPDKSQIDFMTELDEFVMSKMDAYIGIRGGNNAYELSDANAEIYKYYQSEYSKRVHLDLRVNKTKWVILRYPNEGMAQLAGMSTEAFEDYYFDVCTLDYSKMDKAMNVLGALIDKTDKVRLIAKDTDLTFSINRIGHKNCSGTCNIPDGEIYTAPVRDSVNGVITYNAPSIKNGLKFENVRLEFKNGKIINATANYTDKLNEILDMDEGARYVGEFALGVNPFITTPMGDILFDEKISGSIHFTPGACYDDCDNGNKSGLHWDFVLMMSEEYGGGEIYFDNVLIRKNGLFVIPELLCLNPENLK